MESTATPATATPRRFLGIDLGAETIKLVELVQDGERLVVTRRRCFEHHREPGASLRLALEEWEWWRVESAAATGRLARLVELPRVPLPAAQAAGLRHLLPGQDATIVSMGSRSFSVLELHHDGSDVFREGPRCSQGTGSVLRDLVSRFGISLEEADAMAADVTNPAALAGRCPVILRTDMTHLVNRGEDRARVIAGLIDAACEGVQCLVRTRRAPRRVHLTGGVSRSRRVRANLCAFLAARGFTLATPCGEGELFLEATGAAVAAARRPAPLPSLDRLFLHSPEASFDVFPTLASHQAGVVRVSLPRASPAAGGRAIVGFDIGSTGAKAVAIDAGGSVLWQGYRATAADPVGAAQALLSAFAETAVATGICAFGATGSGREVVGSLLAACYGADAVFVLNEIAAHARGARQYEPAVDTIFEIGGQDAKYIRLVEGRVVDAALNEACSAGTGSFIEEQARRFPGILELDRMDEVAMSAAQGVSLGRHCSVFMAEALEEALASGAAREALVAGVYDAVVANYLDRVKGSRPVGNVVVCQGMPFASRALSAAVARRTGARVVVPKDPGTAGALGIALLTREAGRTVSADLDPARFRGAALRRRDDFVCRAQEGCAEPGSRCRVDRLEAEVAGEALSFSWGGACSLWERRPHAPKLPNHAPDPFVQREQLVRTLIETLAVPRGRPRIGLTDDLLLAELFPFFATFLHSLGFDLLVRRPRSRAVLRRGIEEAQTLFCAPVQHFLGGVAELADAKPEALFVPMLRELPRVASEETSTLCPILQGIPDVIRQNLARSFAGRIVSPVVDIGPAGLDSQVFRRSCAGSSAELGVGSGARFRDAFARALAAQRAFDEGREQTGRLALEFARRHGIPAVILLGRPYTVHNEALSCRMARLVREHGVLAIPGDCYPVAADVPTLEGIYWAYSQRALRAAWQIRRRPGEYAVWCSNYACGPDSFVLHFFARLMEGKPFLIAESDGHVGEAGATTRVEAFLHCVERDRPPSVRSRSAADTRVLASPRVDFARLREGRETLLVPYMGPSAEAASACLRGAGIAAECLPMADRRALELGRRHTSGKECLPMCLTLGSLLSRLERARPGTERFAFLMPCAPGPCRLGAYGILDRIVLERLGWGERVRVCSPTSRNYFGDLPRSLSVLLFTGLGAIDQLTAALHHVRPAETVPGAAERVYDRFRRTLLGRLESAARDAPSLRTVAGEVLTGRLFGVTELLARAAGELAAVQSDRELPAVALVGALYVRVDPFASDFIVEKLERHGIRVRLAPLGEWLDYIDYINRTQRGANGPGALLAGAVRHRIRERLHGAVAGALRLPPRARVRDAVGAGRAYVREALYGEPILTVGGPLHERRAGRIAGVVNVGPLECMPCKIGEAHLGYAAEREDLLSLSLPFNGEPLDPDVLEAFAFEVHARHERQRGGNGTSHAARSLL